MIGLGLASQPTTECGIFGSYQSLALDGNSDYVTLPSGFNSVWGDSANSMTMSFWVNLVQNDGDTSQNIIKIYSDDDNQFSIIYHKYYTEWRATIKTDGDARRATWDIPGSGNNDGSGYDDGWQHFAVSYQISSGSYVITLYRNGAVAATATDDSSAGQADWTEAVTASVIGASQTGGSSFVDGHLDQVAFWTGVLSDDSIAAIYNGGTPMDLRTFSGNYTASDAQKLMAYYQFEGNAIDSGGRRYHGSLQGTASFAQNQP